mmetsp:Transcript_45382/g.96561  ORF Transcript_45382/g.96561 Transcript_45382/m.96561 type:complete len:217 (-) Transcript_45382:349-999(-)
MESAQPLGVLVVGGKDGRLLKEECEHLGARLEQRLGCLANGASDRVVSGRAHCRHPVVAVRGCHLRRREAGRHGTHRRHPARDVGKVEHLLPRGVLARGEVARADGHGLGEVGRVELVYGTRERLAVEVTRPRVESVGVGSARDVRREAHEDGALIQVGTHEHVNARSHLSRSELVGKRGLQVDAIDGRREVVRVEGVAAWHRLGHLDQGLRAGVA